MIDTIINKDQELLIFLNNLGSEQWDGFWLTITNQFSWTPLFVFILYLIFKEFGWKKGIFTVLFLVVLIAFSDQFTNFIKNATERIRPCNSEDLKGYLRTFSYRARGYSFWSGHASLSTSVTVFLILILKNSYKKIFFLVLFPLFFGYSRMYLGVHFPIDVFSGYVSGLVFGLLFYKLYRLLEYRVFTKL
ncbi:phosphatase PAP2 family protein [Tenacibaculum sp. S7007]|uniref:Phosphatase PAP2 family protein n=1 Tax=Tenacibaculum pelagium TaxID=2759527 RepID=A0A839AM72_9FLAO|nr:phosphatase PAP2 family protein [Tenacibaculum pelagium]MBA6155488.1 phosphatase PAP2 family protein [Tenacibaculum pelagium]